MLKRKEYQSAIQRKNQGNTLLGQNTRDIAFNGKKKRQIRGSDAWKNLIEYIVISCSILDIKKYENMNDVLVNVYIFYVFEFGIDTVYFPLCVCSLCFELN